MAHDRRATEDVVLKKEAGRDSRPAIPPIIVSVHYHWPSGSGVGAGGGSLQAGLQVNFAPFADTHSRTFWACAIQASTSFPDFCTLAFHVSMSALYVSNSVCLTQPIVNSITSNTGHLNVRI